MNVKSLLLFCLCCFTAGTAHATIVYDTWTSNDGSSGSYILPLIMIKLIIFSIMNLPLILGMRKD
ncbi:hypothetical protein D1115_22835 (plasmid) [Vibrio alfacsensis]|uniref:Uncharacterized protein n=1 Tax=Vibrio alfacsensis TaxID=1074311 RepID=A0ABM6Z0N5_9VIBR|nr:hypothetical protein D1115_22835 [Vibrio alfacsensis]